MGVCWKKQKVISFCRFDGFHRRGEDHRPEVQAGTASTVRLFGSATWRVRNFRFVVLSLRSCRTREETNSPKECYNHEWNCDERKLHSNAYCTGWTQLLVSVSHQLGNHSYLPVSCFVAPKELILGRMVPDVGDYAWTLTTDQDVFVPVGVTADFCLGSFFFFRRVVLTPKKTGNFYVPGQFLVPPSSNVSIFRSIDGSTTYPGLGRIVGEQKEPLLVLDDFLRANCRERRTLSIWAFFDFAQLRRSCSICGV